jgi:hypothetical protein
MNANAQPLIVEEPVFVIVMLAVNPVSQALIRYATRHPPDEDGLGEALAETDGRGEGLVGGDTDTEGLGCAAVRPKNWTATRAMPLIGSVCPAPAMLYAST